MKFGGASVSNAEGFRRVAEIIEKRAKSYDACVVVVSAMENMTDSLIERAKEIHPAPPQREYDMLISVGERVSISLLAMALNVRGIDAVSFTGSQSGIITSNKHSLARIIDVRPSRLWNHLKKGEIAIVAGFQGVNESKDITTLGRGGSDTSAVALGVALDAERVEFYKDVDGIYDDDPKKNLQATLQKHLTYKEALKLMGDQNFILHPRCISLAQKNNLPINVLSFKNCASPGTLVCNLTSKRCDKKIYENIECKVC
ncbi:MAG: Aspartokinase [Chlamydiae bacterium]|nr:Aspartokinase [Chlamydiota bacterium]